MPYKTLLVHLEAGQGNGAVLALTAALAQRFGARVIGIAACEPVQIGYADRDFSGALALAERQIVDDELTKAGVEFHGCATLAPYVADWRAVPTLQPVADLIAVEARCADLIVTGVSRGGSSSTRHADTGELVIRAGRPVLVVPPQPVSADFATIMIAWNDSRECHRAITDALPFLALAERVIVVGVGSDLAPLRARIEDVAGWLARHGITADIIVAQAGASDSAALAGIADDHAVDLIVAGGYGHHRLTEWIFGGVTQKLLHDGTRCALLSH